jgi:hypothetical protein
MYSMTGAAIAFVMSLLWNIITAIIIYKKINSGTISLKIDCKQHRFLTELCTKKLRFPINKNANTS